LLFLDYKEGEGSEGESDEGKRNQLRKYLLFLLFSK
jgi:hypothetical protein